MLPLIPLVKAVNTFIFNLSSNYDLIIIIQTQQMGKRIYTMIEWLLTGSRFKVFYK